MQLLSTPPQPLLLTAKSASLRVFSYGGGVQSNAVLALQAAGQLRNPYDVFVFANVGADSENPATLEYVENVAKPFAAQHGIALVEVQKTTRGEPDSILQRIHRTDRSIVIPLRMSGGKPATRACTIDFKIRVVNKWIAEQDARWATVGMGISLDEWQRMRDRQWYTREASRDLSFHKRREYPLIDLHLRRHDCHQILLDAGLPDAPKSSCWFCPFRKVQELQRIRRDDPDTFQAIADIEAFINGKRDDGKTDPVYFLRSLVPLSDGVGIQAELFPEYEMQACDFEVCHV